MTTLLEKALKEYQGYNLEELFSELRDFKNQLSQLQYMIEHKEMIKVVRDEAEGSPTAFLLFSSSDNYNNVMQALIDQAKKEIIMLKTLIKHRIQEGGFEL